MQGVGPTSVFVDANVWFSRTLRDWIGLLYVTPDEPLFVVHWSEDVLAELIHHLRKKHPTWPGRRISSIRDQLAGTFEAGRVEAFEIDGSYRGRDAADAHVHAAATACAADVLVTCNASDFVWDENTSSYELMHPDVFLVLVDDAAPLLVAKVAAEMCAYWVGRRGEADLPRSLRSAGCAEFAERVRGHLLRQV
ncbi:PIN domain-containing protein [Cellulomonas sp.]|uniref:PIN domain-containing protein n=1 Tax=Cellulomonas sp. TaxID=40001 RepID=UPI0025838B80|nr:PIN domain-containing protein [Cellulomonas sp.]MCR6689073.1 PIN domain-containing protein [Cellulomonas sp.]